MMTNPDSLQDVVAGRQDTKTIIIDEIQKVPQLLGVIHKLIEENKSLRFILTGSSSRKLKRSSIDLLGLIAYRISPFLKRAKRILIKSSKFYFFDAGVFNTLRPKGTLDSAAAIGGSALECIVLHHLLARIEYGKRRDTVYFRRTKSGNEVDFVAYGRKNFFGVEVKHTKSIRKKDLHGLMAFREDYPGDRQLKIDGIFCVPCASFLTAPGKDTNPFEVLGLG